MLVELLACTDIRADGTAASAVGSCLGRGAPRAMSPAFADPAAPHLREAPGVDRSTHQGGTDGRTTDDARGTATPAGGALAAVFPGPSEMAARCRAHDWAATPLGPVSGWSQSLRTAAGVVLTSRNPMFLWWGPELVQLYNDAYRPSLGQGDRHPHALGARGREFWTDIWDAIGPQIEWVMAGGEATWHADQHLPIERNGRLEDVWWTYGYSPVRDDAGRIAGTLVICQETTPRVLAERRQEALLAALELERARLAYVFQQAPAFLAVLRGPAYVFDLVNDAYYQLVGHRALVGRPVWEALPEVRGQGFEERLDHVVATGEPFVGREVPLTVARTPGAPPEQRFVDLTYMPLVEPDGTRAGVIAHGTDVTEQVLARREVERLLGESERARAEAEALRAEADAARAEAEAAARLKTEFLATMSHEFRTPLNAILGYAQLVDMGVLGAVSPAQHEHLERLASSGRHLLHLVDDVLDVAKVDADRLEVRTDVLPTGAAVAAALALVQPQATAKGIRVYDLGAAGPGVPYVGDEHRARQILVNLLSNAVKFTPPGGQITVACGAAAEPEPGALPGGPGATRRRTEDAPSAGWAFVQVEDTGPGVAPELAPRLFEPFVQADGALTREQGGTGLGLAISRRLARLMGGDLVARSRPGAGATFTLWLPGPPAAAETAGGATAADPTLDPPRPARRTPFGVPAIPVALPAPETASAGDGPAATGALDTTVYAVLHALGTRLAADAEAVAERYVAALRADERFPGARDLPDVQLRDHATPGVGLLATRLMTVGEMRGQAPELLADGAEVERVMSELHGAQRHRLGWAEADIERESPLLLAEIERAVRGALDTAVGGGTVGGTAVVRVAVQYATDVARASLEQSTRTAIRAYRFARAAATP
jgi:signal transduction histidine kinase